MSISQITKKILPVLKRHHARRAGIFGSTARRRTNPTSDVDILVDINQEGLSLLDFIGIKIELEQALGKKVDLVEYATIKPLLKKRILSEEVRIL